MFKFYKVYDITDKSRFCVTGACRKEIAIDSCKELFDKNAKLKAVWYPMLIQSIQIKTEKIKKFFKKLLTK